MSLVAFVGVGSPDSDPPTTDPIDTSGADGIMVAVSSYQSFPATGVTDNKGPNTYTGLTAQDASGPRIQWFYCAAPTVGSNHTFTGVGGNYHSMIVFAFSGVNTGTFYDGTENTNDTGMQPGSITPTEDNCIVVTAMSFGSTVADYSIDGGFSEPVADIPLVGGQHFGIAAAYLIQTSAAAANPTWSGTTTFPAHAIAAFRTTGGGGGGGGESAYVFVF